ncbi:protein GET1 [Euphorbia lathyris]|uniref:protein GET1 n=1 Tax=Euphorbia lathyris TaxID=212925 RepID=UPI0033144ECD
MGAEETLGAAQPARPIAAPIIFLIVIAFHFITWGLERSQKRASMNAKAIQLRTEIKQLLKEASTLAQPSTFAQAAKLRRLAAAKEKELTNCQETHTKELKSSFEYYLQIIFVVKIVTYFLLVCWFWRTPVAAISWRLVHPFGKLLSWGGGFYSSDIVLVGIIPWLVLTTRVSKFVSYVFQY